MNTFTMLMSMIPFVALMTSNKYNDFAFVNFVIQMVLFICVAMVPGYKTGRLSYVDIAWPWGLAVIGAETLLMATGTPWRRISVGVVFLFIGGRMGLGALDMWWRGFLNREFPRYDYRKLIWKHEGIEDTTTEL